MLMSIKCSTVASLAVDLKFDDNTCKHRVIGTNDLIEVEFNYNGCRKHVEGRVLKINAVGTDPKAWYLIVDGSDAMDSHQYKFAPTSILDIEIIRKADAVRLIETPTDITGIRGLRIIKGRLQYTLDGFNWNNLQVDQDCVIYDESGTVDSSGCGCGDCSSDTTDDDTIIDESY